MTDLKPPRLSNERLDEIKGQLNAYRSSGFPAPKELLFAAADAIGALQFDMIDYRREGHDREAVIEALRWFIDDIDGTHTVMRDFDAAVIRARAALAERTQALAPPSEGTPNRATPEEQRQNAVHWNTKSPANEALD